MADDFKNLENELYGDSKSSPRRKGLVERTEDLEAGLGKVEERCTNLEKEMEPVKMAESILFAFLKYVAALPPAAGLLWAIFHYLLGGGR